MMILSFTNNSKQKKILIETDFVEDIYDEIQAFFEDYKIRPHYIKFEYVNATCKIMWNSLSELFLCENISAEQISELKELFEGV